MPLILLTMPTAVKVILIVLGVVLAILIVLMILGMRMQKKQQASQADIEAASQVMSMLIIDKKRMKLSEANLPKIVTEQMPKRAQLAKMPIVKAKIGPKIMTLIADPKIYEMMPVKTEVKAKVSGIYITDIISSRVKVAAPQPKGFRAKMARKAADSQKKLDAMKAGKEEKPSKKKKGDDTKLGKIK